jgi:hypothetical protein
MNGYTVFLGPFAGIMIVDVSLYFFYFLEDGAEVYVFVVLVDPQRPGRRLSDV